MANKRVYRNIKFDGNNVGIRDPHTERCIPLDAENADYIEYLRLISQDKALALDVGEALPGGVTDTPLGTHYPVTYPAKDEDTNVLSLKPSYRKSKEKK